MHKIDPVTCSFGLDYMTKSGEEFRKILHYIDANLDWIGEGLYSVKETTITILHGNSTDQQFETLGNCKFLP